MLRRSEIERVGLGALEMDRFNSFFRRLSSKRVRLEKPSPGVEWAEGFLKDDRRDGEWIERIGDTNERTTWRDGKKHGPSKRIHDDGTIVIEREFFDDKPHGKFQSFHSNGKPFCTCEYEHGALVGRYTHHDEEGHLTVDFVSREGKRHGTYRELFAGGVVKLEGEYVDDKREGAFTKRNENGVVIEVTTYAADRLEGRCDHFYDDGAKKLATIHRAGVPLPFEVWTKKGVALGPIAAANAEDAARFLDLDNALESGIEDRITKALHAISRAGASDAVRLCDARDYLGFTLYSLTDDFDVDDPRFALARTVTLDHALLRGAHLEAMRNNRRLVKVHLHEVEIAGSLVDFFAPSAAMRLAKLSLTECYGVDLVSGLVALASSDVAERLIELTIDIDDHPDRERAIDALSSSSRFTQLEKRTFSRPD